MKKKSDTSKKAEPKYVKEKDGQPYDEGQDTPIVYDEAAQWAVKIVKHEMVDPASLLANPFNFRMHPYYQQQALNGSLDTLGWVDEVQVNINTGHIVDGHLRVVNALEKNQRAVPVMYLDLTESEEKQALASLDPIAAMAEQDDEVMRSLLAQIESDNQQVQEFLERVKPNDAMPSGKSNEGMVQSLQLLPAKDYVVILCDNSKQFDALKQYFGLVMVRRGGYKFGSPFDDVSIQRVVKAGDFITKAGIPVPEDDNGNDEEGSA